jgi:hypothetical protein
MLKTKYTSPTLMPEKMLTKNVAKLGRIFAALDIKIAEVSFLGLAFHPIIESTRFYSSGLLPLRRDQYQSLATTQTLTKLQK